MTRVLCAKEVQCSACPKIKIEAGGSPYAVDMRAIIQKLLCDLEFAQERLKGLQELNAISGELAEFAERLSPRYRVNLSTVPTENAEMKVRLLEDQICALVPAYLTTGGNVDMLYWYLDLSQRKIYSQLYPNV